MDWSRQRHDSNNNNMPQNPANRHGSDKKRETRRLSVLALPFFAASFNQTDRQKSGHNSRHHLPSEPVWTRLCGPFESRCLLRRRHHPHAAFIRVEQLPITAASKSSSSFGQQPRAAVSWRSQPSSGSQPSVPPLSASSSVFQRSCAPAGVSSRFHRSSSSVIQFQRARLVDRHLAAARSG